MVLRLQFRRVRYWTLTGVVKFPAARVSTVALVDESPVHVDQLPLAFVDHCRSDRGIVASALVDVMFVPVVPITTRCVSFALVVIEVVTAEVMLPAAKSLVPGEVKVTAVFVAVSERIGVTLIWS